MTTTTILKNEILEIGFNESGVMTFTFRGWVPPTGAPVSFEPPALFTANSQEAEEATFAEMVASLEPKPKRTRRGWTQRETFRLIELFNEGKPYREIGEMLGRTESSITMQLYVLRQLGMTNLTRTTK